MMKPLNTIKANLFRILLSVFFAVLIILGNIIISIIPEAGQSVFGQGKIYQNEMEVKNRISFLVSEIINENDYDDCQNNVKELKTHSLRKTIPHWISILEKTQIYELKKDIIEYIAPVNDKRVIVPFAKQLSSPFHNVRKSAAIALQRNASDRIYPFILRLTSSSNPVYKIYFIEAMNYLYDTRFYHLLTNMLKDPNKSIRIYVLKCLRANRLNEAINMIRNLALYDSNDEVKENAIELIGYLRDRGSQHVLFRTLNYGNRNVRLITVQSLNKIGLHNAAVPLSNRLNVENDNTIKDRILESLIKLRKGGNISGLKRILFNDQNEDLKIKAAYTMGLIRENRVISALIRGSNDSSFKVRAEIANSLGNYKAGGIIEQLISLIRYDKKRYVKSAAIYSLKRINNRKSAVPLFDVYSKEKDPVIKELLRQVIRNFMKRNL